MAITVQQFDFIAEVQGIGAALAAAEKAGGVVGTRSDTPTQVVEGPRLGSPDTTMSLAGTGTQPQYMPGTVTTPGSVAIGAAGSPESAGGVGSAEQQALVQSIMSAAAEEEPFSLPSAPPPAPAPAALSIDDQILAHLAAGNVVPVSDLAQMTDPAKRIEAATQLGKNIVVQGGNTQDTANNLNQLFSEYFDAPGTNFQSFATSVGFQFNPDGSIAGAPGAPPAGDTTTVYFSDGTSTEVNNSELETFLANNPGTATSPPEWQPGMFGASEGSQYQLPERQGVDKEIYDFLTGLYKAQLDAGAPSPVIGIRSEAARMMVASPGMFGKNFADIDAAYEFLGDWMQNPLTGIMSTTDAFNAFSAAATALPTSPAGLGAPTVGPTPGQIDMGGLAAYGTPASLRPFGQIYPGFTSLLPGYATSPALQSAYQQAGAPLETQYLAQQALAEGGPPGTDVVGSDIQSWLQNVQAGTQPLTMGQDYASFLNQLTGALGSPAGAPVAGMDPMVQMKLTGLFQDPGAQLAAFTNPFYQATSGSPQVRNALMNQIQQAAQRYQYQEPSGAFLPWAIEQNIGGIQSILPSLQGWAPPA